MLILFIFSYIVLAFQMNAHNKEVLENHKKRFDSCLAINNTPNYSNMDEGLALSIKECVEAGGCYTSCASCNGGSLYNNVLQYIFFKLSSPSYCVTMCFDACYSNPYN